MKKSRFTEQQIAFALHQADGGTPVPEVCRKMGISEPAYHRRKQKHGGLMPSEVKRLHHLEEENTRPRRLVADLTLDKELPREVVRRKTLCLPARGREMVDFVRAAFRVSVRRACRAVPAPRSTYHYRSRRPEQAVLRRRIREIAATRVRYGYRRIWVLLRRVSSALARGERVQPAQAPPRLGPDRPRHRRAEASSSSASSPTTSPCLRAPDEGFNRANRHLNLDRRGLALSRRHQDVAARKIVGWPKSDSARPEFACDAPRVAFRRQPPEGLIHPLDHGDSMPAQATRRSFPPAPICDMGIMPSGILERPVPSEQIGDSPAMHNGVCDPVMLASGATRTVHTLALARIGVWPASAAPGKAVPSVCI
jgi:hypothetical protein